MSDATFVSSTPEPIFRDFEAVVRIGQEQVKVVCSGIIWNFLKMNYFQPFGVIAEIIAHVATGIDLPEELQLRNSQRAIPEIDESPPYIDCRVNGQDIKLDWVTQLTIYES